MKKNKETVQSVKNSVYIELLNLNKKQIKLLIAEILSELIGNHDLNRSKISRDIAKNSQEHESGHYAVTLRNSQNPDKPVSLENGRDALYVLAKTYPHIVYPILGVDQATIEKANTDPQALRNKEDIELLKEEVFNLKKQLKNLKK